MAVTDADQPFTAHEMVLDRLDEAEDIFETLVEIAQEQQDADLRELVVLCSQESDDLDRRIGWPTNEPDRWR